MVPAHGMGTQSSFERRVGENRKCGGGAELQGAGLSCRGRAGEALSESLVCIPEVLELREGQQEAL